MTSRLSVVYGGEKLADKQVKGSQKEIYIFQNGEMLRLLKHKKQSAVKRCLSNSVFNSGTGTFSDLLLGRKQLVHLHNAFLLARILKVCCGQCHEV